jgi:hypothetical protein
MGRLFDIRYLSSDIRIKISPRNDPVSSWGFHDVKADSPPRNPHRQVIALVVGVSSSDIARR